MIEDIRETFQQFVDGNDFLKFDRIADPLHHCPDLCAFLLLDRLVPHPRRDFVTGSEHDKIWLRTDMDELAEVADEEDIRTLVRCGVHYDDEVDSLCMFV